MNEEQSQEVSPEIYKARKFFDEDSNRTFNPFNSIFLAGRAPFVIRDDIARIMVAFAASENQSLQSKLDEALNTLEDLAIRAERAQGILQEKSGSRSWQMLDTTNARKLLK